MGKTMTNISIVLGLITIIFAGYYMYNQKDAVLLEYGVNDQVMQEMVSKADAFISQTQALSQINLKLNLFADKHFQSLKSFTKPIQERPVGRENPFDEALTPETSENLNNS